MLSDRLLEVDETSAIQITWDSIIIFALYIQCKVEKINRMFQFICG